jgi:hypothetical protein
MPILKKSYQGDEKMNCNFQKDNLPAVLLQSIILLILALFLVGALAPPALAGPPGHGHSRMMALPPVQTRTWKQMEAGAPTAGSGAITPAPGQVPFRPTINSGLYRAAKTLAMTRSFEALARSPVGEALGLLAPSPVPPRIKFYNFEGVNYNLAGRLLPPDTHGAAGANHFVQITNSHLDIYAKNIYHRKVKSISLANFFGWTQSGLFDPRVVYDADPAYGGRWIISADSFADPKTTGQHHWLAVSAGRNPLGAYYIYAIPVSDGSAFWDFPQLGVNVNAIVLTANIYTSAGEGGAFTNSSVLVIPKAQVYAGSPPPVIFTRIDATINDPSLAPAIVLDTNTDMFLASAPPPPPGTPRTQVNLYTLDTSDVNNPTLSAALPIDVGYYELPPDAAQYGAPGVLLDTLDCRFVNASTQLGNSLWQAHTINDGSGFARCRYYEFDTSGGTAPIDSGVFYRSPTSFNFNVSIAANPSRAVFVTWSATDPLRRVQAEVRFSGRRNGDPSGIASPGYLLAGSLYYYNPSGPPGEGATVTERWGDYSAVTIDPGNSNFAWIVNERVLSKGVWSSRIGRIGY